MKKWGRYFQPPVFSDEEQNRRVQALHTMLIYLGIAFLFGGGLAAIFVFEEKIFPTFAALLGLCVITLAYTLNRQGRYELAAKILLSTFWGLTTLLIGLSQGPRSLDMIFYVSGTVAAGLLLGGRMASLYAGASAGVSLMILILTQTGMVALPNLFSFPPLSAWVILAMNLTLVLIPLNLTLQLLATSLTASRKDLTERIRVETHLHSRERILQAVAFAGEQFLAVPNWQTHLQTILARLGEATGVSHVYIFEHHLTPNGDEVASLRFEWAAFGQPSDLNNPLFQNSPLLRTDFSISYNRLSQGLPLIASRTTLNPAEIEFLLERNIKALLEIPLFVHGKWWGTMGFDDYVQDRDWSSIEVDALKVAANVLSAAIERQQADTARQISEARFRAFMETSPSIAIIKDAENRYVYCNPKVEALFGLPIDAIMGKTEYDLFPSPAAEQFTASDQQVLKTGLPHITENFAPTPTGERHDWWVFKFPMTDPDGKQYVGIQILDITARKQAEREVLKLNKELEQRVQERTRRLEAMNKELETFSYSVSHDLRVPLRAIRGFTALALEECDETLDPISKLYLNKALTAAQDMNDRIDSLLTFSRLSRAELVRSPLNLTEMAHQIFQGLQSTEPNRAVSWHVALGLSVCADENLMQSVLDNLLGNAWKYTSKTANPTIAFGVETHQEELIFFIQDNGAGFDMEYADKLFAPFQRMHSVHDFPGHGIGLATVKRIITRHGGRIWVDAKPEHGATFYFTLPSECPPKANAQ